jgi:hypothetical protein
MPKLTIVEAPLEKMYQTIIPSLIIDPRDLGYEGYNDKLDNLSDEVKNKYKASGVADVSEAARLINGKNSLMEIKHIIDSQNRGETSIEGLQNYVNLLKEAGLVRF